MYTVSLVATMAETLPLTSGAKESTSAPVAVSKAATRLCVLPSMVVKAPPTYRRVLSGLSAVARTVPLAFGAQLVASPVVMLYAMRFWRGISWVSTAAP